MRPDPGAVLGVVLAGGLSRRMGGGDKALRTLCGRTLLDRVVERFAPQCAAGLILNANGDPARFLEFSGPVVPDGVPGNPGPLAGILAALDHAARLHPGVGHVASVTGDAPFLPVDLVARLSAALGDASITSAPIAGSPIAMAASNGREHFTVALWPVALRAALHDALVVRAERRVGAFLRAHGAVPVDWPAEPLDPFWNINTPEDLAAAEARLSDRPSI
ncbi:molybdenum cofactor guanylyltransferase MobA [Methylobacterium sp. Leaf100]|uniref:molybdenum cofactor guanylyltransferase MobA n=1 Tax=Methylobacterium sp. Leaf100 TaxID=1736252 RepID=UPI0006FF1A43|nr:molybdenum cofactor guanylyltransferase MobA [Methylobacterium sp. Leaf100]KQP24197.1 molybdenum cofactor guanylyltransferase [Methylobacterium sp. Leaf100]